MSENQPKRDQSTTFNTIRDKLFQLMREKAAAGDESAKRFLETIEVRHGESADGE